MERPHLTQLCDGLAAKLADGALIRSHLIDLAAVLRQRCPRPTPHGALVSGASRWFDGSVGA